MQRSTSIPLLFTIACAMSGLYGMVHNQISYSISSEYFTAFKFHQFQIDTSLPPRLGAAIVGFGAAWWMGIVIGVFLIPCGLLLRGDREFFWGVLQAFGVVLLTTASFSLLGIGIAYLIVSANPHDALTYNDIQLTDPVAFMRAGMMHNFSYLGGVVGILTGAISIMRRFMLAETGSTRWWTM